MKIKAIRLSEVGRFSEPVAIEDLSGGLDVLAGPNELGKSTLLAGVKAALFDKHNSKKKEIEALRPYGGGAPLVEVDIESGGRLWRLRKRFLSQPMVELTPLAGGPSFRGPEAEIEFGRILGTKEDDGRFAMLWLSQKDSIASFLPDKVDGGIQSIEDALAQEITSVAEGNAVSSVQREVRRQLGELLSSHATRRPIGEYRAAQAAHEVKRQAMAGVRTRHAAVTGLLDRLVVTRSDYERLASPELTAGRQARREAARSRLQDAKDAAARRDAAAVSLRAAESSLTQRRAAHEAFEASRREAQRLDGAIAESEAQLSELAGPLVEADEAVRATVAQIRILRESGEALESERKGAAAAETRTQAARRIADLTASWRAASEARAQAETARTALNATKVTQSLVATAGAHSREIAVLRAQLAASAPRIGVRYRPGAEGAMSIGGKALEDGGWRLITEPTPIEIAGIGQLRIEPGTSSDCDEIRADLEAREAALEDLLQQAGVGDLAALEAALAERREIERTLSDATSKLAVLATHGLERLQAELAREQGKLAGTPDEDALTRPLAEVDAELAQIRKAHAKRVEQLDEERQVVARLRESIARLSARRDGDRKRREDIGAGLARIEDLDAYATALARQAEDAESEANAVRRTLTAWSEKAPDAQGLQALEAEQAVAEADIANADRKLQELQLDIANIEGQLETARNEDIEARLAEASAELAAAAAEEKRFADEAAALTLLDRELSAIETSTRDRYLRPVIARLQPYLDVLLPDVVPVLAGGFGLDRIVRNEREEALSRLSDGTQEQLAVLVRLAFARLFSDVGRSVPVVLDDALVYSDDARIARMFSVLEAASTHHQVIVFTCRETAFRGMRARQLSLAPWHRTS
ncbi:MAG: AAA family ATPase [Hyphomicrobiaceae bacterium]